MSIYNTIKEIYNDTSKITGNVNADWKIVGLLKKYPLFLYVLYIYWKNVILKVYLLTVIKYKFYFQVS